MSCLHFVYGLRDELLWKNGPHKAGGEYVKNKSGLPPTLLPPRQNDGAEVNWQGKLRCGEKELPEV